MPGQTIHKERRKKGMENDKPLNQRNGQKSSRIARGKAHHQIRRIKGTSLGFADEGTACVRIHIPKRETSLVQNLREILRPRVGLKRGIRKDQKGVVGTEDQLPENRDCEEKQQRGIPAARQGSQGRARNPALEVHSRARNWFLN